MKTIKEAYVVEVEEGYTLSFVLQDLIDNPSLRELLVLKTKEEWKILKEELLNEGPIFIEF